MTIYRKATDESSPLGTLSYSDWVKELPIKPKKVKKTYYVKNKKGKKVKKVKYETVTPKEPPRFIPVKCKFGSGYANRAELARFFERSKDISGTYSSKTGTAVLQKSPNNPGKFSLVILNGTETERAEFEVGNLELKEANGHSRFRFQEPDCRLDIDYFNRKITILQNGCDAYSTPNFKLGENTIIIQKQFVVQKHSISQKRSILSRNFYGALKVLIFVRKLRMKMEKWKLCGA